ncbi:hypothetical protein GM3708_2645 [Geminocystis sp. NIES-3708]|uniref:hypothetical protein n=1 Tax=Geminocystis sp. NIES-3708 TaxID=1615909 RepID=UPI0005FC9958|nr:hypothetical protein [Geminocystis sp. NIES-3708]BAQ62239.1 hypothetical protein GM3708_2645 [Geminocystis sp. NIES-3708]
MFNETFYLLRSRQDGKYLVANIGNSDEEKKSYLFVFKENFDALGYINHHSPEYKDLFSVESVSFPQLKLLLSRWGFSGIGIVEDILIPSIKFCTIDN